MTFQMSFSGWVFWVSSQALTAISLATSRLRTSTSSDQKHQHQYFPYLFGFSWWSSVHTCHVSPPSIVTSTRVTFFPPPVKHTQLRKVETLSFFPFLFLKKIKSYDVSIILIYK